MFVPARLGPASLLGTAFLAAACSGHRDPGTSLDPHATGPERDCASCHPRHVEEWKVSSHAYALHDPVFAAMVRLGQNDTKGELGDFCVKCHTPLGVQRGEARVRFDAKTGEYSQPLTGLSAMATDGVSCLVCHSIEKLTTTPNASFELGDLGVRRGPISDPEKSPVHDSVYSEIHQKSAFCGTCHIVVNPKNVALERTNIEWIQSGFNGSQDCQDCHMPAYEGPAAKGHRTRTVHEHSFVGVDVSLLPEGDFPGYSDLRDKARTLLENSADFSATADPGAKRLDVAVANKAGHALPSGATADRQMWIEVIVHDASGATVFESGTPDAQGDLRVADPSRTLSPGTDPALVLYTQEMSFDPKLDDPASGEPARLVDFLWEPNTETSHLILPSVTDRPSYDLSSLGPGSYTAALRLLFRTFPPHALRKLEDLAGLDPDVKDRVPTVEMARATVSFTF